MTSVNVPLCVTTCLSLKRIVTHYSIDPCNLSLDLGTAPLLVEIRDLLPTLVAEFDVKIKRIWIKDLMSIGLNALHVFELQVSSLAVVVDLEVVEHDVRKLTSRLLSIAVV